MAHLMKFSKAAIGHMGRHFERKQNDLGEYVKFSNQNINTENSHLNYNLAPHGSNQVEFINKRCSEVKCLNRSDVKVMCSWVVTKPKSIDESQEREFFNSTYDFLENRYGKENVISAYVHNDEVTPHMHFAFIPVVFDKKKELYKVSAKEKVSRNDLRSFHSDLEKHLERQFGIEVGILNKATKEGNRCINELKQGSAIEQVSQLEASIENNNITLNELNSELDKVKSEYNKFCKHLKVVKVKESDIEKINSVKASDALLRRDKVTLDRDDYEMLKEVAKMALMKKDILTLPYREKLDQYVRENSIINQELEKLTGLLQERKTRISLADIDEKTKLIIEKNKFSDLESKLKKVEEFLSDRGLNKEFDEVLKQNRRERTKLSR